MKLGDKVSYGVYVGTVVEVNSGSNKKLNLCKFPDMKCGHNGNGFTNKGSDYDTKDYWYCKDIDLELIEDTTKNRGESVKWHVLTRSM